MNPAIRGLPALSSERSNHIDRRKLTGLGRGKCARTHSAASQAAEMLRPQLL